MAHPQKFAFDGPATGEHQFYLNQIESDLSSVADFFHDYPGSTPNNEEDIEQTTRDVLARLERFVVDRWGIITVHTA